MLSPGHATRIFMAKTPVDFRFGFDRLAYYSKSKAKQDPYGGGVFLFFNRSFTKAKIIFYDGTGSVLVWKRLEVGRYKLPKVSEDGTFASIRGTDMMLLLEGVNTSKIRRGRQWKPGKKELEKPK